MDRCSNRHTVDDKAIARDALKLRTHLLRHPPTRTILARGNNFDPC
jgi:hypothetical protein